MDTLEPDGAKVTAIMDMRAPANTKELESSFWTHELFVKVYAKIGRRDIFVATVEER
jgi:hypothetical protein